jgi:hypothetical protein
MHCLSFFVRDDRLVERGHQLTHVMLLNGSKAVGEISVAREGNDVDQTLVRSDEVVCPLRFMFKNGSRNA